MPFVMVTFGILLIIVGFQNTYKDFGRQLAIDFSGPGNFFYWMVAIGVVGAIGYNKTLEPFSRAFLALILVAIFLTKGQGFFDQFNKAISEGTSTTPLPAGGYSSGGNSSGGGSSDSGGFGIGDALNIAKTIGSLF